MNDQSLFHSKERFALRTYARITSPLVKAAILLVGGGILIANLHAAEPQFTHFTIANPLPGKGYGTAGIALVDFDHDGDMDVALSRRDAYGFWWYERRSDSNWVQHAICVSTNLAQGLGCTALDIDNDGWTDLVFDHVWFKNPGNLRENPDTPWPTNAFAGAGHDILAADVNKDGRTDIAVFDGNSLVWFDPAHSMASNFVGGGFDHHGGITPHGFGDIDGDGNSDFVIAGTWFANPGKSRGKWQPHAWPYVAFPKSSYGTSIRSWVADLDGDGDNDIIYSDCDTGYSHAYWIRNDGKGTNWTRFQLPDPPTAPGDVPGTGSFHSLAVVDFDGDGVLEIFTGEQEDPDAFPHWAKQGKYPMKPKGMKPRGIIWMNSNPHSPEFTVHVIHVGNPGWHDVAVGDVDGDGDLDIVSKIWNKDGPTYHADFWRNDTIGSKK